MAWEAIWFPKRYATKFFLQLYFKINLLKTFSSVNYELNEQFYESMERTLDEFFSNSSIIKNCVTNLQKLLPDDLV